MLVSEITSLAEKEQKNMNVSSKNMQDLNKLVKH